MFTILLIDYPSKKSRKSLIPALSVVTISPASSSRELPPRHNQSVTSEPGSVSGNHFIRIIQKGAFPPRHNQSVTSDPGSVSGNPFIRIIQKGAFPVSVVHLLTKLKELAEFEDNLLTGIK